MKSLVERTLLVVEDDDDLRGLIVDMVKDLGYGVDSASNGQAGLEILTHRGHEIHAVLCDIRMPKMNGIEFLAAIRSAGIATPFVFLTGHQTEENLVTALQLGALDFLSKPFRHEDLQQAVERILEIGVRLNDQATKLKDMEAISPEARRKIESILRDDKQIAQLQALHNKKTG